MLGRTYVTLLFRVRHDLQYWVSTTQGRFCGQMVVECVGGSEELTPKSYINKEVYPMSLLSICGPIQDCRQYRTTAPRVYITLDRTE